MRKVNIIKTRSNENGITLVALVVTIVVLLILAGITIGTLFGDNGIITGARRAAELTKNAQNDTDKALNDLSSYITNQLNGTVEPKNVEDWIYELDKTTNTITILKYKGKDTEVVIPNSIGGVKVRTLGSEYDGNLYHNLWDSSICTNSTTNYGYQQETITKVTISEGIEEIKDFCFNRSLNLKEVFIPKSVKIIGRGAFGFLKDGGIYPTAKITCDLPMEQIEWDNEWTSCTNIVWNANNSDQHIEPTNIEDWEYTLDSNTNTITINRYKGKDTTVVIPNYINGIKVDKIGNGFSNVHSIWDDSICTNNRGTYGYKQETIKNVVISEGITKIDHACFADSVNIKKVILPRKSLIEISYGAFNNCRSLSNITIPSSVTNMGPSVFYGIPTITVTVPFRTGNQPSGWQYGWNNTDEYNGSNVNVIYQQ